MGEIVNKAALHRNLRSWFQKNGRDLPWRKTQDPYAIAVSEFMLQQTRVTAVIPFYIRWMKRFPTVATLAAAGEAEVLEHWQGLGYYSRARNLHRLARILCQEHGGSFPRDPDVIRSLPGVGEYTTAAIRAFAWNLPAPVVDGNVARVLSRWFNERTPVDCTQGRSILREKALALQPTEKSGYSRIWNSAIMELGALVCKAGVPDCGNCPVQNHCQAIDPETLPVKSPRKVIIERTEDRALILHKNRIWLELSSGPNWKGLWILPGFEPPGSDPSPQIEIVYPITRYRVTMRIHRFRTPPLDMRVKAFSISQLKSLAIPSPHRRAVAMSMPCVHIP